MRLISRLVATTLIACILQLSVISANASTAESDVPTNAESAGFSFEETSDLVAIGTSKAEAVKPIGASNEIEPYATDPGGKYPRLALDGQLGTLTKQYFQRYLQGKGWYPATYKIDGSFGPETVKAWQRMLKYHGLYNGVIDGQFGQMTKGALDIWLSRDPLSTSLSGGAPCKYAASSWACTARTTYWNSGTVKCLQYKMNVLFVG